uniref:Electrogenic sodium bicarbonate cotransporter 1 n=1 Tax=Podarcis muralis TaxID=64176 RepID=A0A670IPR5_PODMU
LLDILPQGGMEDEAVLDRGASFLKHVCDDEEVEGHHTVYIGVHVPKSYRRRRRHRRKPKEKKEKEKISENSDKSDVENADETSSSILKPLISPAAERIRFILGEDDDSPAPPQLFTELDELLAVDGQEMEWKETARWIKFEEKVEQGGERWSKPHVATLSLHSLFELRTCIEKGSIMLDLEASSLPQVVEMVVDNQIETGLLKPEMKDKVTYTLLRKHRHQTKKSNLRSLADIGKTVSSASRMFTNPDNGSPAMTHRNLTSSSLNDISDKPDKEQLKNKFMKKLPRDAEASNVLVGEVDFLEAPFIAFVRLQQAVMLGALTEVPVPTRFLFILLGPKGKAKSYHEIGRAIATLMSDEVFHDIAYKAKDRQDLIAGIDEFLDEVIVLPPGEWDPAIRIEPPKSLPSSDKRKNMYSGVFIWSRYVFCYVSLIFVFISFSPKPTSPHRGWIIPPFGENPWWVYLAAAIPALLVTILIFMDQQITAVIVNRKEHKLKKGAGYHLDLFLVAVLMIICSFMGLPWYVAATVISIAHIDSLKMETETSAPGEQPKFLGVREQRVTGVIVFILTGISVFMAPILKFIPMPVLYGVFLYMGVASLNGVQFMDRLKLLLMPLKHQPDFIYLRHVPLRRVHLFTFLQVVCLALLWILKSTVAAIIFPVMILALVAVRKAMDYLFSQHDLSFLDDVIPEKDKKKKEDEKKKKKKKGSLDSDNEDEKNHQHSLNAIHHADKIPFLHSHTMPSPPRTPMKVVPQIRIELDPEDSYFWRSKGTETTL